VHYLKSEEHLSSKLNEIRLLKTGKSTIPKRVVFFANLQRNGEGVILKRLERIGFSTMLLKQVGYGDLHDAQYATVYRNAGGMVDQGFMDTIEIIESH